jgi:hypothetical protein
MIRAPYGRESEGQQRSGPCPGNAKTALYTICSLFAICSFRGWGVLALSTPPFAEWSLLNSRVAPFAWRWPILIETVWLQRYLTFNHGGTVLKITALILASTLLASTAAIAQARSRASAATDTGSTCSWAGRTFSPGAIFCMGPKTAVTCKAGKWETSTYDPCNGATPIDAK